MINKMRLATGILTIALFVFTNNTSASPTNLNNTLAVQPFALGFGAARVTGRFKQVNTPLVVEYERRIQQYSLAIEGYFQNQDITRVEKDWFDGEIFKEETSWRRKQYRATLLSRYFLKIQEHEFYVGGGLTLGYSSLAKNYGDLELWDQHAGRTYYTRPFGEAGYQLTLFKYFNLTTAVRLGPIVEINHQNNAGNHVHDLDFNTFPQYFLIRTGINW